MDLLRALVRTLVPLLVGWLLSQPLIAGAGISDEQAATVVTALVQACYYIAARLLERAAPTAGGVLLGWVGAPTYEPRHADDQ